MGVDPEIIYSLAFVMFVAGIVGARLFYILQKRDQFHSLVSAPRFHAGRARRLWLGDRRARRLVWFACSSR